MVLVADVWEEITVAELGTASMSDHDDGYDLSGYDVVDVDWHCRKYSLRIVIQYRRG